MDAPQFDDHMRRISEDPETDSEEVRGVALNDRGFASFVWNRKSAGAPIQLFAWSHLEGQLSENSRWLSNQAVILTLSPKSSRTFIDGLKWITLTDGKGRFRFKDVPAGDYLLFPSFPGSNSDPQRMSWTTGCPTNLTIRSGRTNLVLLRESGPRVRGSAIVPGVDLSKQEFSLTLESMDSDQDPDSHAATHFQGVDDKILFSSYAGSDQRYQMKYKSGEPFEFADVAPGRYRLRMTANQDSARRHMMPDVRFEPPAMFTARITIPEATTPPRRDIQLGVLELKRSDGFQHLPQPNGPPPIP